MPPSAARTIEGTSRTNTPGREKDVGCLFACVRQKDTRRLFRDRVFHRSTPVPLCAPVLNHRVGARQRRHRLPQRAERRAAARQVARRHKYQVHIARHLPMLKPVVEHQGGGPQDVARERAGDRPLVAHQHGDAGQIPGQHQWFVARAIHIGQQVPPVRDHHHAILCPSPAVAPGKNRGPFTHFKEQPRNGRHSGRLPPPTKRDIPDGDYERGRVSICGKPGSGENDRCWENDL